MREPATKTQEAQVKGGNDERRAVVVRRPNRELVVYALYLLGGEQGNVHTEDIAIKCHELFPDSFSWTRYRALPDKDIVRVALTDARKQQYGALVEGRSGQTKGHSEQTQRRPAPDGWRLTAKGVLWLRSHEQELQAAAGESPVKEHRQRLLRELKRVREHPLFQDFLADTEGFHAGIGQIAELMRCRVDAAPRVWQERFESMRTKALAAGQDPVAQFIDMCSRDYLAQR